MHIQDRIMTDFINELLNEQTSQSQQVKASENEQEILKNIKQINQVLTAVYQLNELIKKQKELKTKKK